MAMAATVEMMAPTPLISKASSISSSSMAALKPPKPPLSPPVPSPRTITELISSRARELPSEPILGYPSRGGVDYVEYTFSDLELLSSRAARIYSTRLPVRTTSKQDARVVALLGPSTLEYVFTALALSRLGFTVLFLSTRLSEAAYLSLLEATKCRHMVVDASFRKVASTLSRSSSSSQSQSQQEESESEPLHVVDILDKSEFILDQVGGDDDDEIEMDTEPETETEIKIEQRDYFDLDEESGKIAWIIHSSGSTGFPKPIYQTHKAALRNYENNMNMVGFLTLPLFHAHGLSSVFRGITAVKKIYMYGATLPLTSQNLLQILRRHDFDIFYGVPYALKLLGETQQGIDALAAMKIVMFGGSACPDALGDRLAGSGVNLISHYGTTETGQLMTSFRPPGDRAWNYVREHERLKPYMRMEERGGNLYELVVLDGWPSKVATNRDDGAYATKDLFEPHPSIAGAWKYSGRLDDTIVLMNGEKAIPIAMEQALRQHELVREAVMFGAGKSQVGMIIIASPSAASLQPQELIDAIWPTIVAENKPLPAYAQLARDMIKVVPAETAYPSTDKGTVMRQAFYRTFQQDIDDVYRQAESRAAGTLELSDSELREFLRTNLLELSPQDDSSQLTDDTDLFSLGVDSLQSTRLRAKILKEIQLNGNPLPQNVVFEYPTIAKLATAILSIRDSKVVEVRDVVKEMEELVAKYGVFPAHVPVPRASEETCVVVTGATGSLGAHLVAQLVLRDDVSEVCCLVRADSVGAARQRVVKSMQERAVWHTLPLELRRKISCYPSDFSKPDLGLGEAVYAKLSAKITNLVHCAWSVNFNKNLSSFEADCIAGARHLMLLCLSAQQPTPASFNFCSSVSTVASTPGPSVPEDLPESFRCAQGMGYAQSKLVTEHLVARAASATGMRARVLRVGQIIADTKHGIWNDTEAIPLMLQAATTFGALPALDESPRWLPVDTVAAAMMDISLSATTHSVFNIVNPRTFHWARDLLPALRAAGLSFAEVGQREWIRLLRVSNPDPEANPTIKLVDFFASKYDNDVTKRKKLDYATATAEQISSSLGSASALSTELVRKFVDRFLTTSWAPPKSSSSSSTGASRTGTRLIVLSGPCGVGKTTVATQLAESLACPVIEGDAIHDAIAIAKMSQSIPLTSLDRQIWLSRIKVQVLERVRARQLVGTSSSSPSSSTGQQCENIVLTCSALARSHRDALRNILGDNQGVVGPVETVFVLLQATEEELIRRVAERKGHYMKTDMVKSQLDAIEQPGDEEVDVFPVDAEMEIDLVMEQALAAIQGPKMR